MKNRERGRERTRKARRREEEESNSESDTESDVENRDQNRRRRVALRKEEGKREVDSTGRSSDSRKNGEERLPPSFAQGSFNEDPRSSASAVRQKRERSKKGEDNEIPITETLRNALDKGDTDYYGRVVVAPSDLITDKIYVQGKNGFSAVKIVTSEEGGGRASRRLSKVQVPRASTRTKERCSPITVAIVAQKCWKRSALVYQGLLAGMALVHFIMTRTSFDASMKAVVSRYSLFSEIYSSLFSFLVALSVISIFDKFDVACLDRLRDIRRDYLGSSIAIPLYVATLCLHESFANSEDRLALIHHNNINDSRWDNDTTNTEDYFKFFGSTTWQRISESKDTLAVVAWLLVAVGTQDDTLLEYLESMQGYDLFEERGRTSLQRGALSSEEN